jgi:Flp pilus assembly protein TadG
LEEKMNTDHAERPETASRRPGGRVRRRSERGQSLVELALMLPVILFLLVGVVEVGNALNAYLTLVDGARDGARWLQRAASDDDIRRCGHRDRATGKRRGPRR